MRALGHEVLVVDQYDGRSFDDYATAIAYQEEVGFPALMQAALDATADLPDDFVVAGFSNGAGPAVIGASRCSRSRGRAQASRSIRTAYGSDWEAGSVGTGQ
jgi:hypothetical protein